jgi:hypothetical protein
VYNLQMGHSQKFELACTIIVAHGRSTSLPPIGSLDYDLDTVVLRLVHAGATQPESGVSTIASGAFAETRLTLAMPR